MTKKPPFPPLLPDEARSGDELPEELAYLGAENAYLKELDALTGEKWTETRGISPNRPRVRA